MALAGAAGGARVLVVDDTAELRRLLVVLLVSAGYLAVAPADVNEALALLADDPVDAVLLDLNMPGMTGEEFHARARAAGYSGPVVVLSADKDGDKRSRALGAAFVAKPFDPAQLLDVLQVVLTGSRKAPSTSTK